MDNNLVDEVYKYFCDITEPEDISHPYLSEDTNYMLAFDEWGKELEISDLEEEFPDITEEKLDQLKKDISNYVDLHLIRWAGMKPIENIR